MLLVVVPRDHIKNKSLIYIGLKKKRLPIVNGAINLPQNAGGTLNIKSKKLLLAKIGNITTINWRKINMDLPIRPINKLNNRFISKYYRARQNYNRFSSKSRKYRKWVKACMKVYNAAINTPGQLIP